MTAKRQKIGTTPNTSLDAHSPPSAPNPTHPKGTTTEFWARQLDPAFEGPESNNDVIIFESGQTGQTNQTLDWPFVSRGEAGEKRGALMWRLDGGDAPGIVEALTGYYGVKQDAFGQPGEAARLPKRSLGSVHLHSAGLCFGGALFPAARAFSPARRGGSSPLPAPRPAGPNPPSRQPRGGASTASPCAAPTRATAVRPQTRLLAPSP